MLLTCQAGFESLFARELTDLHGVASSEQGPGWVTIQDGSEPSRSTPPDVLPPREQSGIALTELAFAHLSLVGPHELRGDSVNALASRIAEFFLASVREERIDSTW